jgi:hypothetical protein
MSLTAFQFHTFLSHSAAQLLEEIWNAVLTTLITQIVSPLKRERMVVGAGVSALNNPIELRQILSQVDRLPLWFN